MSKTYDLVTKLIIEKLEQGVVPWHCPWKRDMRPAQNLTTMKPYRGFNQLITSMMGYSSPYWLTFKQAKDLGAHVRKGETGTPVLYWSTFKVKDTAKEEVSVEAIERQDDGTIKSIPFLKHFIVFNVDQIDGLKLDAEKLHAPRVIDFAPIDKAQTIADSMQNRPAITHGFNRACYIPHADSIRMPSADVFENAEEYYSTLFHEITHSTGHKSRLDRHAKMKHLGFGTRDYGKEELVAEMGAAMLCYEAAIENKTIDNSASYLDGWLKAIKGNPRLILDAASAAQKAADYVLNRNNQNKE